jgi:hypothetical protein
LKLLDLPRNTFFTIVGDDSNTVLRFERLDGSYSVCWNEYDKLVHINAMAEVNEVCDV